SLCRNVSIDIPLKSGSLSSGTSGSHCSGISGSVYSGMGGSVWSGILMDWLNDPTVNQFLETGGDYTIEKLNNYLSDIEKKEILFWGIHIKENDTHIGNIKIDPVNFKHGIAEYGIMLGRKTEWGKGYAKEATNTIIEFCFRQLRLRKITLGVVADNYVAYNLYQKVGFEIEGLYKKHGLYNGNYCDIIRMAKFNPILNEQGKITDNRLQFKQPHL
ncbi:MAG: GNAT family protein, partial [Chloroflexi bacterium]|nr:GNAT family protein [Chloroflexota bacterium]